MGDANIHPLVSIIVVSYNSSATVIETLESIISQGYSNMEIIITDDASSDDTIDKCHLWKEKNDGFFKRIEIITSSYNSGIPSNLNRGIIRSKGKWCKIIAADDILLPNCIFSLVDYVTSHKEAVWVFAKMHVYNNTFSKSTLDLSFAEKKYTSSYSDIFKKPNSYILSRLAKSHFLSSPTVFAKRSVFEEYGLYDESFKYCEDYPMHMSLLEKGIRFSFLDEFIVGYRRNANSVTSTNSMRLFNPEYIKCEYLIKEYKCFRYLERRDIRQIKLSYHIHQFFDRIGMNRNTFVARSLFQWSLRLVRFF